MKSIAPWHSDMWSDEHTEGEGRGEERESERRKGTKSEMVLGKGSQNEMLSVRSPKCKLTLTYALRRRPHFENSRLKD